MKPIFILLFLGMTVFVHGQTKFKQKVKIKVKDKHQEFLLDQVEFTKIKDYIIYELKEIEYIDTLKIDKKSILSTTKLRSHEATNYEVKRKTTVTKDSVILHKRKKEISEKFPLPKGKYSANLYVSKDSIFINFWLYEKNGVSYYDLCNNDKINSPYHPDKKYYIKLKNRQSVSFPFSNYEISILTIPFKYSFGFEKDDKKVDPVLNTNLNISTFVGKRFGRIRYSFDNYKGMIENEWSLTMGAIVGLSSQKIDSLSTSLSTEPLTIETNVPTFTYGIGAVLNIKDFNFGLFLGVDNGLGNTAQKWNFNSRLWLGFGFGYKIAFLGKQE